MQPIRSFFNNFFISETENKEYNSAFKRSFYCIVHYLYNCHQKQDDREFLFLSVDKRERGLNNY